MTSKIVPSIEKYEVVNENTILTKNPSILEYFPFTPTPEQKKVLVSLEQHPHILWNAPTGFGKTIVSLVSMFYSLFHPNPSLNRIVVFVRTKTQIFHILEEVSTLHKYLTKYQKQLIPTATNPLSIFRFPLVGKEEFCIYTGPKIGKSIHCKSLGCKFYGIKNPPSKELKEIAIKEDYFSQCHSSEQIKKILQKHYPNHCPYFLLRQMMKFAQVIVTTHAWLMSPALKKLLFREFGLDNSSTGIIIDEVHNFRATEVATLKFQHVQRAVEFCAMNNLETGEFLKKILILFQVASTNIIPTRLVPQNWYLDQLQFWQRKYYQDKLTKQGITAKEYLCYQSFKEVTTFLGTKGEAFYLEEDSNEQEKRLTIVQPYPELILREIYDFKRVILMSGTMFPPKAFAQLFNIVESYKLLITLPSPRKIIYCTFFQNGISSRLRDRTKQMLEYQAKLIEALHNINSEHTMIFSPSEPYSKTLHSLFTKLPQSKDNSCVHQGETSKENEILLKDLQTQNHTAIFATLRGRLSEGVEIRDKKTGASKIRMIIITGVPFTPPTKNQQLLEHNYQQRWGKMEAYMFLQWMPVYQLLLQAVGRGIRRPTDYCAIISLDNRIPELNVFPKELSFVTDKYYKLKNKLLAFYQNQINF